MTRHDVRDMLDGGPLDMPGDVVARVLDAIQEGESRGYRQGYDVGYMEAPATTWAQVLGTP